MYNSGADTQKFSLTVEVAAWTQSLKTPGKRHQQYQ